MTPNLLTHTRKNHQTRRRLVSTERQLLNPLSRSNRATAIKINVALLIAAHNEELVLENTLRSAINAGMLPKNIYVVDDNSTDMTSAIARGILPWSNVVKVARSGKGLALSKASSYFSLTSRYQWIHIADADGGFSPDYFQVLGQKLDPHCAAATGYVRSMPHRYISQFRAFEYTLGMELHRRLQILLGVIPVIPGPTSCFRADVFEKVNFANGSLTEDFDVTLQIYRQKLGAIQFIPQAIAYTQDPRNLKDYIKQITRWYRGTMQGVVRHKIGRRPKRIDAYLSYQIGQNLLLFANQFIWIPYLVLFAQGITTLAITFLFDVFLTLVVAFTISIYLGQPHIMFAFPIIYAMRWINLFVFLKAFVEVVVLRKYRHSKGMWSNAGRRYKTA